MSKLPVTLLFLPLLPQKLLLLLVEPLLLAALLLNLCLLSGDSIALLFFHVCASEPLV